MLEVAIVAFERVLVSEGLLAMEEGADPGAEPGGRLTDAGRCRSGLKQLPVHHRGGLVADATGSNDALTLAALHP